LNNRQHSPTHPNTGKHYGGHASGAHTSTDSAPGQAHSASGGAFGVRSKGHPQAKAGARVRPTSLALVS
jgi:hypothetical protein